VAIHSHISSGGWTIGPSEAAVQRYSLTTSTWTVTTFTMAKVTKYPCVHIWAHTGETYSIPVTFRSSRAEKVTPLDRYELRIGLQIWFLKWKLILIASLLGHATHHVN
jgi:hypothetical protein